MKYVVLKPFGWCPDGFTREALDVGDERDFGTNTAGMLAAGMIGSAEPVVPAAEVAMVAIAAEWTPPTRRKRKQS